MLDVINSLCIEVDADMRAQRSAQMRRAQFPLSLEHVLRIERCPGWTEDRVIAFASRRAAWVAADVAEDAFAAKLLPGDAVWLLLQVGVLPPAVQKPFVLGCADAALRYTLTPLLGAPHEATDTRTAAAWRAGELALRTMARDYSVAHNEALAQRLARCSRLAGIVATWLRTEAENQPERAEYALQASHLAYQCCNVNVPIEVDRQLKHLHALVT